MKRLRALGFEATLWVTPFAEPASDAYAEGARLGHWQRAADGSPRLTRWWQGDGAVLNVSG